MGKVFWVTITTLCMLTVQTTHVPLARRILSMPRNTSLETKEAAVKSYLVKKRNDSVVLGNRTMRAESEESVPAHSATMPAISGRSISAKRS